MVFRLYLPSISGPGFSWSLSSLGIGLGLLLSLGLYVDGDHGAGEKLLNKQPDPDRQSLGD